MRKIILFILPFLLLACTSPYAGRGMPEISGINAVLVGTDEGQLTFSNDFVASCEYRRNAVLLKSAYIALMNDYDHFDFVQDDGLSRTGYNAISLTSNVPIKVYLCRGTCPLMYSADATSHLLVAKFSHATWDNQPRNKKDEKCFLEHKH